MTTPMQRLCSLLYAVIRCVAVMHLVMRSAMLPCNRQTTFLANQTLGSLHSCSRSDK